MPDSLVSWGSNWQGLRVVVFGLGVTGFSVADTLAELGADQLVIAEKADAEHLDILDVLGVNYLVGDVAKQLSQQLIDHRPQLIVTSPGIRPDNWLIQWAAEEGIPVWVDIELAWRLRDKAAVTAGGPVPQFICITGTNGKTTTTQLTEAMLVASGFRAIACGNIGTPILDAIRDPEGFEFLVVELSSFQLHYLGDISPVASAVLNIADDHLDWHGGFENYAATKGKVYENTQLACVYNVQDKRTEALVEEAEVIEGARAIGFTLGIPARSQVGYVEDLLCDRAFLEERAESALEVAGLEDISKIGVITPHLLANIAAATALARSVGVAPMHIREALREFKLDAHRIELVAEADGIQWIDDSKATNPHATAASLASFEKVIWVVGGLLKGVDLEPLVEKFADRIKHAIVIGADREPVLAALNAHSVEHTQVEAENSSVMQTVITIAAAKAESGDTVLLAPAAASMDQFKDYADRGKQFAEAVHEHLGKRG
ncbi:MAG: UDP-N-acetylmuramoyl-L-alanine--D-glutamate ligase [Micrococcales bacterium]